MGASATYNDAKFRVQSVLLTDECSYRNGYGRLYVSADNTGKVFVMRHFDQRLVQVRSIDGKIVAEEHENDAILQAILQRIRIDMYHSKKYRSESLIRGSEILERQRHWDYAFTQEVKQQGEYLALDARIRVNPVEWGQTPLQEGQGPETARKQRGMKKTSTARLWKDLGLPRH